MASTREWITFFQEARIPRSAAAQYAMTFTENRISMDMLMDLNKEYLKDMGITVLGDIIAILKHAKEVQSRLTTDRAFNQSSKQDKIPVLNEKQPIPVQKTLSSERDITSLASRNTKVTKLNKIDEKFMDDEASKQKKTSKGLNSSIAKRLGPPAVKPFESTAVAVTAKKKDIFSRLGQDLSEEKTSGSGSNLKVTLTSDSLTKTDASSANSILRKRLGNALESKESNNSTIIRLKPSSSESTLTVKKPSEKTHDKRVSFGDKRISSAEDFGSDSGGSKRKKYVMVTTKRDGSKVKEILDPEDPRIAEIGVIKKTRPQSGNMDTTERGVTTGNFKNMRITLSNTTDEEYSQIKQSGLHTTSKVTQGGTGVRQRITAPESTTERQPVSRSKFRSESEIIPSLSRSLNRTDKVSNVKDRISSPWENSSSHVKPKTCRVTAPEEGERDQYTHQKPISRKRISGFNDEYANNSKMGSSSIGPQRKRIRTDSGDEPSRVGNVPSRLAGRLGASAKKQY